MKKIFNILIIITLFLSMNLSVSSCAIIRGRNRYLLEQCLKQADDAKHEHWCKECESLGKKKDCMLPFENAERLDKLYKERKDECFKKYPQD